MMYIFIILYINNKYMEVFNFTKLHNFRLFIY